MTQTADNALDQSLVVRQAIPADVANLVALKPPEALHRDRFRDVANGGIEYWVAEGESSVIAFALLVFWRPASWPDANDTTRLPAIVDLFVAPQRRSQGIGSRLLRKLEWRAQERRHSRLYLGVDPIDNPRALSLYKRLGYQALQKAPRLEHWRFVDSSNLVHEWDEWTIDMAKTLHGR